MKGVLNRNGCDYDDGIADTPNEELPYSTYIEPGNICGNIINSCNTPYPGNGTDYPDLQENYMNYSTDLCYAMFTKEQVNMMRYALTAKRNQLIINREIETSTGMENISADNNGLELFPNPTKGMLNIRQASPSANETIIQVYNTMGAVVMTERIPAYSSSYDINLSNLAPSVYFMNFVNGNTQTTEKIVIQ